MYIVAVFLAEAVIEESKSCMSNDMSRRDQATHYTIRRVDNHVGADSETAISLHGSLPRSFGEMIPIVTRSHSMGMYDEVYNRSPPGPAMRTFGRSLTPASLQDPDTEYEYVNSVPRSRSMGHDASTTMPTFPHSSVSPPHCKGLTASQWDGQRSRSADTSPAHRPDLAVHRGATSPTESYHSPVHSPTHTTSPTHHSPHHYTNHSQPQVPSSGVYPNEGMASRVQVKPLSPIGEILPIVLSQSPRSNRKLICKLSQAYEEIEMLGTEGAACQMASMDNLSDMSETFRHSQMLTDSDSEARLARSQKSSSPECDKQKSLSFYSSSEIKAEVVSGGMQSRKNLQTTVREQDREINVNKMMASAECLSEMSDLDKDIQEVASPSSSRSGSPSRSTERITTLSIPAELQHSMDDLDSQAEMGSIGSFNELSKSLNSLLNDVGSSQGAYPGKGISVGSKDYMTVSTQANIGLTDSESASGTTNSRSGTTHSSSVQYDSSSSMDSGTTSSSLWFKGYHIHKNIYSNLPVCSRWF